jgi:LysM repeat protein
VPATAPSPLKLSDFDYLPWGPPIAIDGSLFVNRDLGREGILLGGQFYDIDPATDKDIDFSKWFTKSSGTLGGAGLSALPELKVLTSLVLDDKDQFWLLNKTGKTKVDSDDSWVKKAQGISSTLIDKLPTNQPVITGANFIKADSQSTVYLLQDGVLRAIYNEADMDVFSANLDSGEVIPVSVSGMSFIPKSVMILPSGLVVKNQKTGVTGIIDSQSKMISFTEDSMKLKLEEPRALSTLQLIGYPSTATFGPYKLTCSGQIFVAANGLVHESTIEVAKELPGISTKLSDASCAKLSFTDKSFGRYIGHQWIDPLTKKTIKKAYKIVKGKRLPFKSLAEYKLDNKTDIPLIWVDDAFVKKLPLGKEMTSTTVAEPTPTAKPKTYTIVAGDSLIAIATKFKTTVAKLMQLNQLVNSDRIRIGQVLKLP